MSRHSKKENGSSLFIDQTFVMSEKILAITAGLCGGNRELQYLQHLMFNILTTTTSYVSGHYCPVV